MVSFGDMNIECVSSLFQVNCTFSAWMTDDTFKVSVAEFFFFLNLELFSIEFCNIGNLPKIKIKTVKWYAIKFN